MDVVRGEALRGRVIFFGGRLLPNLLGMGTTVVLTRLLQPGEYGMFALGLSIILFTTMGVFEWLGLSLLRMAPKAARPTVLFGVVVSCFTLLCCLSSAVTLFGLFLFNLESYTIFVLICLGAAFAVAMFELQQRLKMSELREADYFVASAGRCVITFLLVCGAAFFTGSAAFILLALGLGGALSIFIKREPRLGLHKMRFNRSLGFRIARFGLPLSISVALATMVGGTVDKWILQGIAGPESVGLLTAANMVAQVPIIALAGGIGPWAYSLAVQALERSGEETRAQLAQNLVVLVGVVMPGAAGIVALSANLGSVLVGETYQNSVVLLAPWLSASAVLGAVRAFYLDVAFQLAERTSYLIWTTGIACVVNISLDFILIPIYGELGAAMAIFAGSLVGFTVTALASTKVYRLPFPMGEIVKVSASSGIMFLFLTGATAGTSALLLPLQIGLGILIYFGALIAFDVLKLRQWFVHGLASMTRL